MLAAPRDRVQVAPTCLPASCYLPECLDGVGGTAQQAGETNIQLIGYCTFLWCWFEALGSSYIIASPKSF